MPPAALELPCSLAWAQGGYSVELALGAQARRARVLLDTGSSSLAVLPRAWDPDADAAMRPGTLAQRLRYGGGDWTGPLLQTSLAFGEGRHARRLAQADVALIEAGHTGFRGADGILGLAYAALNPAFDLGPGLRARGLVPATWPWAAGGRDPADLEALLAQAPCVHRPPTFAELEAEGVVAHRFGLLAGRALMHVAHEGASPAALAADPLNRGVLALGGGAECQSLYQGGFADVRILHDRYYNANLRALRVGADDPIPVPPVLPADPAASNALLDTGSSFLVLDTGTWQALRAALGRRDPRLPDLVDRSAQALARGETLAMHEVAVHDWPDLHLHLEAPDGDDTVLRVPASHYWPGNALGRGRSLCLLMPQLPHFPRQSILGLPLFAGRYAVFDRAAAHGLGVVRFAAARA